MENRKYRSNIVFRYSEIVRSHLDKIPFRVRSKIEEINLDLAGSSMNNIANYGFPNTTLVTYQFHV